MPKMRRKLQHIPHDECLAMLRDGQFGTLAVHGADGYPYAGAHELRASRQR